AAARLWQRRCGRSHPGTRSSWLARRRTRDSFPGCAGGRREPGPKRIRRAARQRLARWHADDHYVRCGHRSCGNTQRACIPGFLHRVLQVLQSSVTAASPHNCLRVTRFGLRATERPPLARSEEHTSELQSLAYLVCRLLLEKKKKKK